MKYVPEKQQQHPMQCPWNTYKFEMFPAKTLKLLFANAAGERENEWMSEIREWEIEIEERGREEERKKVWMHQLKEKAIHNFLTIPGIHLAQFSTDVCLLFVQKKGEKMFPLLWLNSTF